MVGKTSHSFPRKLLESQVSAICVLCATIIGLFFKSEGMLRMALSVLALKSPGLCGSASHMFLCLQLKEPGLALTFRVSEFW